MPRIPLIDARPGQRSGFGQRATPADFGGGFGQAYRGRGITDAGQSVQQIGAIEARIYDASQRAKVDRASAEAARKASLAVEEISQGPDPDTYLNEYDERRREIQDDATEGLAEGYKALFDQQWKEIDFRAGMHIRGVYREKQVERIKADTIQTLGLLADEEARATTPEEKGFARARAAEAIANAKQSGAFDAREADMASDSYDDVLARSALLQGLSTNPRATLQALEERAGPYSTLHEPERQEAIGAAKRAISAQIAAEYAAERRSITIGREIERQQSKQAEQELMTMLDPNDVGSVAVEEVFERSDRLSPAAQLRWLKVAQNGGRLTSGSGDTPGVYNDLRERANAGEPIFEDATGAYMDGQLSRPTYNTLLDESSTKRFKPARDWLNTVTKVRTTFGLPPSDDDIQREADAKVMFDSWVKSNPEATDEDALTKARDIALGVSEAEATRFAPTPKAESPAMADAEAIERAIERAGFPPGTSADDAATLDPSAFSRAMQDARLLEDLKSIRAGQRRDALKGTK